MIIAIGGGSASGKTTVARLLAETIGQHRAGIIEMDAYYRDLARLSVQEREQVNFDHPDAVDRELFLEHLACLRQGREIVMPVYDFSTHTRTADGEKVPVKDVMIVEGLFALVFEEARLLYDHKIFIEAEEEIRFQRRLKRDVAERGRTEESVRDQYYKTVQPMYREHIEPGKYFADRVIIWNEPDERVIEQIINSDRHFSR